MKNKHPKGLPYLFFTEMWERFGYYLILGIFVLYMIDADKGGLAFDSKHADDIFGRSSVDFLQTDCWDTSRRFTLAGRLWD